MKPRPGTLKTEADYQIQQLGIMSGSHSCAGHRKTKYRHHHFLPREKRLSSRSNLARFQNTQSTGRSTSHNHLSAEKVSVASHRQSRRKMGEVPPDEIEEAKRESGIAKRLAPGDG